MADKDESGQDTPDEIRQLLLKLAEEGSMEEIQRAEALFRVHREAQEVSRAPTDLKLERASERLAANVSALSESLKLHFEAYKNLTVLNSGALVAFALVTHNLVPSPAQQSWLYAAYSFVLISLISSLTMTFIVGRRMFDVMRPDNPPHRRRVGRIVIRLTDALATGTFILGLFLFLQFLNVNL